MNKPASYRIIACIAFFLFCLTSNAQVYYRKGFLITNNNDTLQGFISDGGKWRNSRKCLYKPQRWRKVVRYKPDEIKAYCFQDDKRYISHKIIKKGKTYNRFIETLIEGPINLYTCSTNKNMTFFVKKEEGPVIGLSYEDMEIIPKYDVASYQAYGSKSLKIRINTYRDTLRSILSDDPASINMIKELDYKLKSFRSLSKLYIENVCKSGSCITYEKDYRKTRPHLGVYAAINSSEINYFSDRPFTAEKYNTFPVGVFLSFPVNWINERISLQIEMNMQKMSSDTIYLQYPKQKLVFEKTVLAYPVMLKYCYPLGFITPSIGVGKEFAFEKSSTAVMNKPYTTEFNDYYFSKIHAGGWFGEFGINYKISAGISAFTNIRFLKYKNVLCKNVADSRRSAAYLINKAPAEHIDTKVIMLIVGIQF